MFTCLTYIELNNKVEYAHARAIIRRIKKTRMCVFESSGGRSVTHFSFLASTCVLYTLEMVEGPGCTLNGEKIRSRIQKGQHVKEIRGGATPTSVCYVAD